MKRIAIDCRALQWKHSGIARYIHNILLELAKQDLENEYYLLSPVDIDLTTYPFKNLKKEVFNTNELIYKFLKTPIFIKKEKIDIYWSPTQDLPLWKPKNCEYISTIHDAAMEYDMSPYSFKVRLLHALGLYSRSAKLSDVVFTDSYFSRKDVSTSYRINLNKIIVTYLGVDPIFRKIGRIEARKYVNQKFNINDPYIFMVNTGRPKNLLLAFSKLKKNEWENNNIKLIILGRSINDEESVILLSKKLHIEKHVLYITDHVTNKDLNYLYSGSEFYVSPSFYEGFGLTPLEALKSGRPILVSDVTALPEIYKDTAVYCDPHNSEDIAGKMLRLLKHPLTDTKEDVNKVIKKYTWEKTTREIIKTFSLL